jgi:malto-oligosyltrehalose trehalohydrolase
MKHHYGLPFGATLEEDGAVRFGVWAPARQEGWVKLLRPEGDLSLPMQRDERGWFHLITYEAKACTRYFYDFGDGVDYPDPASRRQPDGIHGASEVVGISQFDWTDEEWRGRPWNEAIVYELHVGTFSAEGTYTAIEAKLDHLVSLGITAIELMPLAQGPGNRGWGYDGAFMYAPEIAYGTPDELKSLVNAAHARGLMMFLDVVYNHFGPEGSYHSAYAPNFFTNKHITPWGAAINFDDEGSEAVRQFYWHNALYWLEEYRFDGLRCDAVHTIVDDSPVHIFEEIAMRVDDLARRQNRLIHMIDENENNVARLLERDENGRPKRFTAQWNDDFHHCMHVILTGETDAYYVDYADKRYELLARCLAEGFAYQGEASPFRQGKKRGSDPANVPMPAFIDFLQNHDQAGNRPMGERMISLTSEAPMRAGIAVLALSPSIPMVFMGEEWGSTQPFPYFCDFGPDISKMVREGRIKDFAVGDKFADPAMIEKIPDPTAIETFQSAKLDWQSLDQDEHRRWLDYWSRLFALRRERIVPLLDCLAEPHGRATVDGPVIEVRWPLTEGRTLVMTANLCGETKPSAGGRSADDPIFSTHPGDARENLPPWFVAVTLV